MDDAAQRATAVFACLRAAVNWREAVGRAEAALAHAADVHQGIEPGSTKAEHRTVTALEAEARTARDAYDLAAAQLVALHRAQAAKPPPV